MNTKQIVKLALVMGILTLMVASVMNAQGQQRMRMTPEQQATVLKDSLSLDSTQTAKITAIYKDQQDQVAKLREESGGDFQAMRDAMTGLRTKTEEKIKAVLTDTQKTKYEQMLKNRPMGRMGGGRGN